MICFFQKQLNLDQRLFLVDSYETSISLKQLFISIRGKFDEIIVFLILYESDHFDISSSSFDVNNRFMLITLYRKNTIYWFCSWWSEYIPFSGAKYSIPLCQVHVLILANFYSIITKNRNHFGIFKSKEIPWKFEETDRVSQNKNRNHRTMKDWGNWIYPVLERKQDKNFQQKEIRTEPTSTSYISAARTVIHLWV